MLWRWGRVREELLGQAESELRGILIMVSYPQGAASIIDDIYGGVKKRGREGGKQRYIERNIKTRGGEGVTPIHATMVHCGGGGGGGNTNWWCGGGGGGGMVSVSSTSFKTR